MSDRRVLIDSHILIWLLYEPEKISSQAQELLESADFVYLSIVSLWELTLKFSRGKLAYSPTELAAGVEELNLSRLQLRDEHLLAVPTIELDHKDPFDELLIAQANVEGYTLLTADSQLLASKYSTFAC